MVYPTTDEAIRCGLVEQTTYRDAFDNADQLLRYEKGLESYDILDQHVYRVTPKGNGLVVLARDFGVKKRDPSTLKELKPAWAFPR